MSDPVYRYDGYLLKIGYTYPMPYEGYPYKVNLDGCPSKCEGRNFHAAAEGFMALSKAEQRKYIVKDLK